MKLVSSRFIAPALLAAQMVLAGCSSENSPGGSAGGTSSGGSSSAGKAGSSSGGSITVGGAGAAGSAAGSAPVGGTGGSGTAGSGTAGSGTAGAPAVEASFTTVKNLFSTSCFGGNGCHGQEGNPMEVKLDDSLYTSLITHTTKNCGKLIDPTNAAGSALVKILQGDCGTPPNTTPRMPFGGSCLDGDTDPDSPCVQLPTIAAIQAWIAKGAPKQ